MKYWFNKLQVYSLKWADTKWSSWIFFICAFADASFLPLPTLTFFFSLILLNVKKAYQYAFLGTTGTLLGALAGYSIGHFAWLNSNGEFTMIAQYVFNNFPGFSEDAYNNIHIYYAKWDFWILFIASLVPVPYKIFSISSGVFDINVFIFSVATITSQGIKFYLLALLTVKLGPEVKKILKLKFKYIAIIVTACIIIVIVVVNIL